MKQFYSCIDPLLSAPQPEQHDLSRRKAAKEGGQIMFYGAEEYCVAASQPFIFGKLKRIPEVDGVIFFTIDQFCYGKIFNLKLLFKILEADLSVHFAREDISLYRLEDLEKNFLVFSAYFHTHSRRKKEGLRWTNSVRQVHGKDN